MIIELLYNWISNIVVGFEDNHFMSYLGIILFFAVVYLYWNSWNNVRRGYLKRRSKGNE